MLKSKNEWYSIQRLLLVLVLIEISKTIAVKSLGSVKFSFKDFFLFESDSKDLDIVIKNCYNKCCSSELSKNPDKNVSQFLQKY